MSDDDFDAYARNCLGPDGAAQMLRETRGFPQEMPGLSERIFKILRSLDRHRERYLRAWMAHYRAHPADVHIVTRMNAGLDGGDVMRMEYRKDSDHVAELVKAAREVLSETLPTSQADLKRFQALEAAVLKFTREA